MRTSPATVTPASSASQPHDPAVIAALKSELIDLLGRENIQDTEKVRVRASADWAKMSPILAAKLPGGIADVVAYPRSAGDIPAIVDACVRLGVPITVRGKGTGNYGQAIPLSGGLVIDTSQCRAISNFGDGYLTAEAGARMLDLDNYARARGQEVWMYPSTAGSALGGFLAGGSGGTGSIRFGSNFDGFVRAIDVIAATSPAAITHHSGPDVQPYLHTYGTTGIIASATISLTPATEWVGLYAAFDDYHAATAMLRLIGSRTDPWPRLVSLDEPELAAALPDDAAIPAGKTSLRAIVDAREVPTLTALILDAGHEVTAVRTGPRAGQRISAVSYNHSTHFLQQKHPDYYHLEVVGEALIDDDLELRQLIPGLLLHLEAAHTEPLAMLMAPFISEQNIYDVTQLLRERGMFVHSPHNWYVDRNISQAQQTAAHSDPAGLLNPGKLIDERLYLDATGSRT